MKTAVTLSGGGIRSAAFNLGVLQVLKELAVLQNTDSLLGVSGGNFIASAFAYSHSTANVTEPDDAWLPGSAEENHLRRNLAYLGSGVRDRVWLVLNLVLGFILNYLPFLLSAMGWGLLTGWAYTSILGQEGIHAADLQSAISLRFVLGLALILGFLAVVFTGIARIRDVPGAGSGERDRTVAQFQRLATTMTLVTTAWLTIALVLPFGISQIASGLSLLSSEGAAELWRIRLLTSVVVFLIAALVLAGLFRGARVRLVSIAGGLVGLLLLAVPFLMTAGPSVGVEPNMLKMLAAVFLVASPVAVGFAASNASYSMHPFYRRRLQKSFILRRRADDVEPVPFGEALSLHELESGSFPDLVICAAVNLTGTDLPHRKFADSFRFSAEESGSPSTGYVKTEDLHEAGGPHTALTLPSLMAISGAAIAPLMGAWTSSGLRFLLALANVRLGVWIPNPARVQSLAEDSESKRVKRRFRQPGPWFVLKEALGVVSLNSRFVYVSDGGHYDNLGLVEALATGADTVLVFDASSDQAGEMRSLFGALREARSRLRFEYRAEINDLQSPKTLATRIEGTIDGRTVRIIYAKARLADSVPPDIVAFATEDKRFPNHTTLNQFFSDRLFEAYRALGRAAAYDAIALARSPVLRIAENAEWTMIHE